MRRLVWLVVLAACGSPSLDGTYTLAFANQTCGFSFHSLTLAGDRATVDGASPVETTATDDGGLRFTLVESRSIDGTVMSLSSTFEVTGDGHHLSGMVFEALLTCTLEFTGERT